MLVFRARRDRIAGRTTLMVAVGLGASFADSVVARIAGPVCVFMAMANLFDTLRMIVVIGEDSVTVRSLFRSVTIAAPATVEKQRVSYGVGNSTMAILLLGSTVSKRKKIALPLGRFSPSDREKIVRLCTFRLTRI